jgi:hypothetical protein
MGQLSSQYRHTDCYHSFFTRLRYLVYLTRIYCTSFRKRGVISRSLNQNLILIHILISERKRTGSQFDERLASVVTENKALDMQQYLKNISGGNHILQEWISCSITKSL